MIRFWAIVVSVLAGIAAFASWSLGAVLPSPWLSRGRAALIFADVISIAALFAGMRWHESLSPEMRRAGLIAISMLWMGEVIFVLLVCLARFARLILRMILPAPLVETAPVDEERRRLLFGAAAYPLLAAGAGIYGGTLGRTEAIVREIDVPLPQGAAGDGLRIAQLSDIHLGMFFSLDEWTALLDQTSRTGTDALVVTGDLFDDDDMNEEAARILDGFFEKFPKGIWFCYGNHEYFRNIRRIEAALERTRINVLRDRGLEVIGGGRPLWFVGVDYPRSHSVFKADGGSLLEKAMNGIPKNAAVILLAHHPDLIDSAAEKGVMLALTGHTHGGQFGIFGVPLVPPVFKYMRGIYRVGPTLGYVHSGNGSWFPCRVGCPPEIAIFNLRT